MSPKHCFNLIFIDFIFVFLLKNIKYQIFSGKIWLNVVLSKSMISAAFKPVVCYPEITIEGFHWPIRREYSTDTWNKHITHIKHYGYDLYLLAQVHYGGSRWFLNHPTTQRHVQTTSFQHNFCTSNFCHLKLQTVMPDNIFFPMPPECLVSMSTGPLYKS